MPCSPLTASYCRAIMTMTSTTYTYVLTESDKHLLHLALNLTLVDRQGLRVPELA